MRAGDARETGGGTGVTARAPAERIRVSRRSSGCHRMRLRRPGRRNAGGDGATGSTPRCGARRRNRSPRPDVWDQQRWCARFQRWRGREWRRPPPVLAGDRGNLLGNSEHHVEVLAVEQFSPAPLNPLGASQGLTLRTVPIAAGAVANQPVAAVIALLDLSAESRGATHFDGRHHASLRAGYRCAVLVSPGAAVAAEDVRHLELRTIHETPC